MSSRAELALSVVLRVMRPLVSLLIRSGVAYPALAAALKRVFLEIATDELARRGSPATDSALSLLSGVHRRDIRTMTRTPDPSRLPDRRTPGIASELFARWLADPDCVDSAGRPRVLPRGGPAPSFDALAAEVSHDVRPRALLDELVALGVAVEEGDRVRLLERGFVPRKGHAQMLELFGDNVADHAAAAVANIQDGANFLEQAVFVDQLSETSARIVHEAAVEAWKQAFATVLPRMRERFEADASEVGGPPRVRARFGVYFHSEPEAGTPLPTLRAKRKP